MTKAREFRNLYWKKKEITSDYITFGSVSTCAWILQRKISFIFSYFLPGKCPDHYLQSLLNYIFLEFKIIYLFANYLLSDNDVRKSHQKEICKFDDLHSSYCWERIQFFIFYKKQMMTSNYFRHIFLFHSFFRKNSK